MDRIIGIETEHTIIGTTTELVAGAVVGGYCIKGQLGMGGMGRVYAAVHPVIAKRAAIKVLHPELSSNAEAVERFAQEARAVNEIGHPNIVDVFAFGQLPDGRTYLVMEWLRGESLRDRIKRELPLAEALAIIELITHPLEAAHEHGIVHRDLKPDNVFLVAVKSAHPQVKLLDFGIAKLVGADSPLRTQTGMLLGTPAYLSPEQARAQDVDHRTDIYALGAMLFELVTGELAFMATSTADMIAKHLMEPPRSAATLNPDVPAELDDLLARMLAKHPAERPTLPAIRDVLRALRDRLPDRAVVQQHSKVYASGTPISSALPIATTRRSRAPVIVGSMLVAMAIGAAVIFASSPDRDIGSPMPPAVVAPTAPADAAEAIEPDAALTTKAPIDAPIDAPQRSIEPRKPRKTRAVDPDAPM